MNRVWLADHTRKNPKIARMLKLKLKLAMYSLRLSNADLSVALVENREIRELNRKYRKKNRATDVLSFSQPPLRKQPRKLLGDVVISVPIARQQARESGKPLTEEMTLLGVHGLLHLLGHDHETSKEAALMFRLQKKLLREILPHA